MGANGATTTPYTLNGILQFLSVSTSVTLGGSLTVSSTTASTTTSTGALIVSGGAGIAGAVSSGYLSVIGTNGAYNVANKFGVDHFGGQARVYSNGPDTSNRGGFDFNCVKSDGTAQITALSISKVGDVSISSTTSSTSTSTGALVVSGGIGSAGAIYASGLMQSNANTFSGSNVSITLTTQNTWYSLGLGALSGLIVVRNRSDGGIGLYWCDAGIGAYAELVTLANFEFRIGSGVPEMRCTSANNKLVRIAALACDLS